MALFSLDNWPLLFISAAMIVAAVIDGWKLKVPNWLTFPLIFSGWILGLIHSCGWLPDTGIGGLGSALAGTALGFALLLPIYAIGGMGAGDVKMQMGFGSWVCAFFGASQGLQIILYAFCAAVIIGGVMALFMIVIRGQYQRNLMNTREILGDLASSPGIGAIADKAAKRKPRLHLLPYGIPLCLGFVGYLVFMYG
ncbi:A24 family peptidase [soil metagenome]